MTPTPLTLTPVVPTALGEIAPRWQPETAYLAGDRVFAFGQLWSASEGVSGTDEPAWQTAPNAGDTVSE